MTPSPHIHWFRRDLRLGDNPALTAAAAAPVIPVYILDPQEPIGAAARWWLHHSLLALSNRLGGLTVLRGDPAVLLPELAQQTGAKTVFWNRVDEPTALAVDQRQRAALARRNVAAQVFPANLLCEPWQVATAAGGSFKVFTPFWKALRKRNFDAPIPPPRLTLYNRDVAGLAADNWDLLPKPNWAAGWNAIWQPGETGAHARLDAFLTSGLTGYAQKRDFPALPHVSRLSAHLHWGEISVRQLWNALTLATATDAPTDDIEKFLSELAWRDFAYHLLYHAPDMPRQNWNRAFDRYPWRDDDEGFAAWTKGETGYALVDAGMRELWATGAMHNRVRMGAASFLTKHLRIDWRRGAAWFADTLVDADTAVNAASWQWVAGSGADAAPYFRIFNPMAQAEKFDPAGAYIRRWNPEAGLRPPIVEHASARAAALEGFRRMRS